MDLRLSESMSSFVKHPQALVESPHIGDRTRVWAFAHILPGAVIGADCNICDHVFIENDVIIGDRVTVKCGIYIWDGVRLADLVFLGPNVVFTNDHSPRSQRHTQPLERTLVARGASIGANATILPGLAIGQWAMVGSGSVVTRDVPAFALVLGNPARHVGHVCVCARNLTLPDPGRSTRCPCGRSFRIRDASLELDGSDAVDW